mmetsp:Transcript_87753/g.192566  ORF Transcript_87753/g.192566 Transcript_87753/m.192566 type:complete len:231 (-) Transcript_87753:22-714(-)
MGIAIHRDQWVRQAEKVLVVFSCDVEHLRELLFFKKEFSELLLQRLRFRRFDTDQSVSRNFDDRASIKHIFRNDHGSSVSSLFLYHLGLQLQLQPMAPQLLPESLPTLLGIEHPSSLHLFRGRRSSSSSRARSSFFSSSTVLTCADFVRLARSCAAEETLEHGEKQEKKRNWGVKMTMNQVHVPVVNGPTFGRYSKKENHVRQRRAAETPTRLPTIGECKCEMVTTTKVH